MYAHSLDDLLISIVEKSASDLHLVAGSPPMMRLNGALSAMVEEKVSPEDCQALVSSILTQDQINLLNKEREIDFAYAMIGVARFRVNACFERGSISATFRNIPDSPPWLEEMGFSPVLVQLTQKARGLVLVTGPTGSGKSTTLAAMINYLNETEYGHILTVEDPIEFVHESKKCLINQREVGPMTLSFANALRSALREDPDAILVGEMRDLETIRLALSAAETGHLVFGTLHTSSAAKTVDRIVDVFPAAEKDMVRSMISESLRAVISQSLLKKIGGGRAAAHEIMIGTGAIRNLIRENKIAQMYSAIQTGQQHGMQTLDQCLQDLLRKGVITKEEARGKATQKELFT